MSQAPRPAALVTGAAGFLGSHLCERLVALGHDVLGVDCFTPYYDRRLKEANLAALRREPRFTFEEVDLTGGALAPLLTGRPWVFHQAAQPGVRASWDEGFETYTRHNLLATQRLLEGARRSETRMFVFASSSSVYGEVPEGAVGEEAAFRPLSPYGVTKAACEQLVGVYHREFGVPTICLRYFTVCGPRQRPDMAFHRILRALLRGEEFLMNGDGTQERDFTYVADAVEGNLLAARQGRPGSVYNIGGGEPHQLREAVGLLEEFTGRRLRIRRLPRAEGDPERTAAYIGRARAELGYSPLVPLAEALRAEADWFLGPEGPPALEGWA